MSPALENELLKKAGYSDRAIEIYRFLKDSEWKALDGDALAEAYLKLLEIQKGTEKKGSYDYLAADP